MNTAYKCKCNVCGEIHDGVYSNATCHRCYIKTQENSLKFIKKLEESRAMTYRTRIKPNNPAKTSVG